MGSLGDVSLADIGRALGRYKPVAATVLAILVALAILPKPDRPPGVGAASGVEITTPTTAAATVGSGGVPSDATADAGVGTDLGSSTFSPPTTTFSSFSSSFPSGDSSDSSGSSASPSADVGSVTSGTSTVDTTGPAAEPVPLRVVGKLWAARTGGTPLATQDVPAGSLPVAFRATDDKISFVKLAGDGTSLGFAVDTSGTAETSGPIKLQACKVTEAWSDGEAIPLQDAPTYDANKCVEGTLGASGVWLFDLSSFSDRTDQFGFAIKGGAGAGLEWRVALKP